MVNRPMPFRNPAGHAGLRQNLSTFVATLTQFVLTRFQLAARESKNALRHIVTMVAAMVAAAVLLLFGYVFLVAFVVTGVANLIGISWIWTALIVSLLHFSGALVCLIIVRAQVKHPMFRETASVLKEDSEWLKKLDQKKDR